MYWRISKDNTITYIWNINNKFEIIHFKNSEYKYDNLNTLFKGDVKKEHKIKYFVKLTKVEK